MMKTLHKRMAGTFLVLLLAVFTISAISVLSVSAADNASRLVDGADLLSDSEESDLLYILDEISERQQVDIVVVTVDSTEGVPVGAYADDFYDYNGYGFGDGRDGILLLISMEERDWYISTCGYGITALTDVGREYISGKFVDDLSIGDYAAGFTRFAELCDDFIMQANSGEPYDVGNLPEEAFGFAGNLVLAFVVAFIIALIVTGIMKGQLKTVCSQSAADDYMNKDSLHLTKNDDLFLYRNVDRREKKEDDNSGGSKTHTSSSGETHGGGGGKF